MSASEQLPTGDWSPTVAARPAELPMIPGYEILGEVGRGGMGVVYKARQLQMNRVVALKLIRDGALASPQELGRFRIEAEAIGRVRHPNVVKIYEADEYNGRPYIAMELIDGESLDKHIAGQVQAPREAAEIVRTLATAIQHAHAQQVVHRDLKPANVLLERQAPNDAVREPEIGPPATVQPGARISTLDTRLRITDFGLAKRLDNESTAWTQDGAVLGTASYMAPEQAAGRVREIGPTVDLYALGAILYELLTGRPPFHAETRNQTLEQVIHDEPIPPTRLQPRVPSDLETVCLKCLEKEPSRRYGSAAELADDLDRFLRGEAVGAVPLSTRERLVRVAARDGYQVIDEIGRGPRSIVYLALYGSIKQRVALKVFTSGICSQGEWESRLERGTELWGNVLSRESLAAAIAHPNIVAVQQAGWWDGAPYLALEYVPHGSLAAKVTTHRFSIDEALALVARLAEVVVYLHRQGVVHANLKPSNVLLAADGIPRVVDFRWIAALPELALITTDRGTAGHAGLGYLAPEQVANPSAEPRPYTDVYGLGTILYELLTGRPPFSGSSAEETLEQVRTQEPEPPTRLNRKVTPQLESLCMRCLRKSPWRRYRRAYDVLQRLKQAQGDPSPPHSDRKM